jgi:transcription initiation factor TFIID TATA-box-binding protein
MMDAGLPRNRSASIGIGPLQPKALHVRNVVASAKVAGNLPVEDLAAMIRGAEFNRRLHRLVIRLTTLKATALIFGSGKVVLTGLSDPGTAAPALAAVLEVLRHAGVALKGPVPVPRVVNLVASGSLGGRILLYRLAIARNFDRVEFDPEQFPGLVYRSTAGGVALIFGTGSIVIVGARSIESAEAVAAEVWSVIDASGARIPEERESR